MSARPRYFPVMAALFLTSVAAAAQSQSPGVLLPMSEAVRTGVERGAAGAVIRNAYLDFAFKAATLEKAQESLSMASELVENNTARVSTGRATPIDVVSARAEQATRSQRVTQAADERRSSEIAL